MTCLKFIVTPQAPVAAIIMWSVPNALRPLGSSMMTVYIHLLGDVPSPPLLGLLQSYLSKVMLLLQPIHACHKHMAHARCSMTLAHHVAACTTSQLSCCAPHAGCAQPLHALTKNPMHH